ncbi:MAG: siroheme synthase CysG [Candidatus Puniceispirillaceae bacterium]
MMEHFPVFMKLQQKRVAFIGNSHDVIAKVRLFQKTPAKIVIYADSPCAELAEFIAAHQLVHSARQITEADLVDNVGAGEMPLALAYLDEADSGLMTLLDKARIPFCVIDDLKNSQFTTPALVDRAPVTIAIGTEGTAPVLARIIKAMLEETLPQSIGELARIASQLRSRVANAIQPQNRRHFWQRFFAKTDYQPGNLEQQATDYAEHLISQKNMEQPEQTRPEVTFVGAGPGDPDLLTLKARKAIQQADVILYDRLVTQPIMELARREAELISVGKTAYEASWKQEDIHKLLVAKAKEGKKIIRLKSGDCGVFSRLEEEIAALDEADIAFRIIPGITAASAGAAAMGASLTKRGRNNSYRVMTGHDVNGFAEHDWQEMANGLSDQSFAAAIYMGVKATSYLSGRLLMHNARPDIMVTIAENIGRSDARYLQSTLGTIAHDITSYGISGPAVIFLGLAPHASYRELPSDYANKELSYASA